MLKYALEYLARGWSVFPIVAGDKKPRLAKWAEFQKRAPTLEEVTRWWTLHPTDGIALATGPVSGVVVIDVDGGKCPNVDTDLISRTGRESGNGRHLFCKWQKGIRNRTNLIEGVDIRGEGGYVILPPSLHASGRTYAWISEGKPGKVPAWVTETIEEHETTDNKAGWVDKLLRDGPADGTWNDSTAKIAGVYLSAGMSESIVVSTIIAWQARFNDPLSEKIIARTVKSIADAESRRDKTEIELIDDITPVAGEAVAEVKEKVKAEGVLDMMSFEAFTDEYGGKTEDWLIENWIPDDTILMMLGKSQSRKSWLEYDAAISVATGLPFLGVQRPNRTGPVMLFQQEDPHGMTIDRLLTIHWAKLGVRPPREENGFIIFSWPESPDIWVHPHSKFHLKDRKSREEFAQHYAKIRPVLTIFDPLYQMADARDNMQEAPSQMKLFKDLRTAFGGSFWISHHTSKGAASLNPESGLGSNLLTGFAETKLVSVAVDEQTAILVSRHSKAHEPLLPVRIQFNIDTKQGWTYKPEVRELEHAEAEKILAAQNPVVAYQQQKPTAAPGQNKSIRIVDDVNLTVHDRNLISLIKSRDGMTQPEMVALSNLAPKVVSGLLNGLRNRGMIADFGKGFKAVPGV